MQEIKKGWKKVKLGDVIKLYNGKSIKKKNIGQYNIYGANGKIGFSDIYNYENAIILGRVGIYCGSVKYSKNKFFASDNTIIVKVNEKGVEIFYYYLLGNLNLNKFAGGSAQPLINQGIIKSLEISIPENIKTQQKIASVLSKYDDLIENNNKRIKVLEEIVQSIYGEWFVNYNFPGSEEVKMVDSGNDDFGMVPEGWEVKNILDYIDFIRGVEPGSKNYKEKRGKNDINFIRVGDLGKRNSGIFIDNNLTKGKIINENDVLVTFDGTVGIVKRGFNGCYSTGMRKIIGKSELLSNEYLYLLFKSEYIQNKIKEHAKGTTILHAGESIKYMKIIKSPNFIFEEFNKLIFPVLEEVLNLQKQNKNLKKSRDLLIPRLVGGELDVEDLDIK